MPTAYICLSVVANPPAALKAMGIIRDDLDSICEALRRVFDILDEHSQKMKPLESEATREGAVEEMMGSLPPEKAEALTATFRDLLTLFPPSSMENVQTQLNKVEEQAKALEKICADLHKILDGVV